MMWLWILAFALLAAVLILSYLAYRKAFYSSPRGRVEPTEPPQSTQYQKNIDTMRELIALMQTIPYERVEITARDGTHLVGRYIHVCDGAPLQIQCHGYRGGPVRDFCGGNKLAREMGHNTLVIEQRAHASSGGPTISFGIPEDDAYRMASETPAVLMGWKKGRLEPGYDAEMIFVDESGALVRTLILD
jgi:hypothetical protein